MCCFLRRKKKMLVLFILWNQQWHPKLCCHILFVIFLNNSFFFFFHCERWWPHTAAGHTQKQCMCADFHSDDKRCLHQLWFWNEQSVSQDSLCIYWIFFAELFCNISQFKENVSKCVTCRTELKLIQMTLCTSSSPFCFMFWCWLRLITYGDRKVWRFFTAHM